MTDVHHAAQQGFGAEAGAYARGRPDYPPAIETWIRQALLDGSSAPVVDLGAGTGKLTRRLQAMALNVVAIEPVEGMRAEFARQLPAVQILPGMAEAIPLDTGVAQALLCAQAFHWFANSAALAEIHRVLKPGGRFGLIWNVRDETVDWVAAITRIITPYEGDTPRWHTGDWRKPFDGRYFSEPELTCLRYSHVGSPQSVIMDRFLSVSFIAALPAAEKARVAEQLRALIADHPALRGKATLEFPYQTQAYMCRRLDPNGQ